MPVLGPETLTRYTVNRCAGVAKLVDATDLNQLSALRETEGAELPKFGETGQRQSRAKRPGRTAGAKV